MSTIFVSRFLLLRVRLDLGVRVFEECFAICSWTPVTTFSVDGSSGGASGQGVRFDGTVISKGGSIIHLYKTHKKSIHIMHAGQLLELTEIVKVNTDPITLV